VICALASGQTGEDNADKTLACSLAGVRGE
jgi:hypothetical protein